MGLTEAPAAGTTPSDYLNTKWTGTLAAEAYVFVNGPVDLLFDSKDAVGNPVERFGAVTFRFGPVNGPAPTPPTEGGGPFFPEPPDGGGEGEDGGGDYTHDVEVLNANHNGPICVNQGNNRVNTTFTINIQTKGLSSEDGDVTVSYVYLAANGSEVPTNEGAAFVSGGQSSATYLFEITAPSEKRFAPGSTVEFTVKAKRDNGDNHTLSPSPTAQVTTSC